MSFGTACVLITLIICVSILISLGMDYSHQNKNKIREYEETISRLEKLLETEGEKKRTHHFGF